MVTTVVTNPAPVPLLHRRLPQGRLADTRAAGPAFSVRPTATPRGVAPAVQQLAAQVVAHRQLIEQVGGGGHGQRGGKHHGRVGRQAQFQCAQPLEHAHHIDMEDVDGVRQLAQEVDACLHGLAQPAECLLAGQREHHQDGAGQADGQDALPFDQGDLLGDEARFRQQQPAVEGQARHGGHDRQPGVFDEAGAQDQLGQQHAVDEFDDVGIAPEGQCRLRRGQRMQQGQTHQQGRGDQQPVGKRDLQGHEEDQVEEDLVVQRPAQQQQWQVVLERFIPDRNEEERAQQRGRIELQAVQHARRFHGHAGQQQGAQPVQRHDADQPAG